MPVKQERKEERNSILLFPTSQPDDDTSDSWLTTARLTMTVTTVPSHMRLDYSHFSSSTDISDKTHARLVTHTPVIENSLHRICCHSMSTSYSWCSWQPFHNKPAFPFQWNNTRAMWFLLFCSHEVYLIFFLGIIQDIELLLGKVVTKEPEYKVSSIRMQSLMMKRKPMRWAFEQRKTELTMELTAVKDADQQPSCSWSGNPDIISRWLISGRETHTHKY